MNNHGEVLDRHSITSTELYRQSDLLSHFVHVSIRASMGAVQIIGKCTTLASVNIFIMSEQRGYARSRARNLSFHSRGRYES